MALGFIHVILEENLYDKDFVEKWTIGFDKLVDLVKDYTPEKVERLRMFLRKLLLRQLDYLPIMSGNISPGLSIELVTNGFQTARAYQYFKL